ncbi:MAG: hypothetical protein EOM61_03955 [Bacteroidia bacterium]|nr:hypothetical protein [Bacteroidia bacterium]
MALGTTIGKNSILALILLGLLSSCVEGGKRLSDVNFFYDSYLCEDSLSRYDLSLFARLPQGYGKSSLDVVMVVTTPSGDKYSDTLMLPITRSGIEAKTFNSGIWTDYSWRYRWGVSMPQKGKWKFFLKTDISLPKGSVGVVVTKLQNGKG